MGPLASAAQLDKFLHYVQTGCNEGACLRCGGTIVGDHGFFVRPAVFADAVPTMRIVTEEVFAPLIAFQGAGSLDEAIDLANATEFGLSAAIVTADLASATRFAHRSKTGLVKINQPTTGMAMNALSAVTRPPSTQTYKEQAGATLSGVLHAGEDRLPHPVRLNRSRNGIHPSRPVRAGARGHRPPVLCR